MSITRFNIHPSWWTPVKVAYADVEMYLSEMDYERYKGKYITLSIDLHFLVHPKDTEVGILEDWVEYTGEWAVPLVGNYPDAIKEAITKYLGSIDVIDVYGEKLEEQIEGFIDQQTNPY